MIEQFGVAETCTPELSFAEDLAACIDAEVGGIGISESKLPDGSDAQTLADFFTSGLRATLAVPVVHSVLPAPGSPEPADPAARIEMMCASVRRLAAFDPAAVGIQAGPAGSRSPAEARAHVVHALRVLSRTAAVLHPRGIPVALEPVAPGSAGDGWTVTSLAEAAQLIDEAGEPNIKIVFDSWHLAGCPAGELGRYVDRIAVVQLADRETGEHAGRDRLLPGHGSTDLGALVAVLTRLGYRGWYELEAPAGGGAPAAAGAPAGRETVVSAVRAVRQQFRSLYRSLADLAVK